MAKERAAWLAGLRRVHRSETILTLMQLQELGPGLYTTHGLVDLLGVQSSSVNLSLARLKCAGLVRYEGWCKKGRLLWWVADWDDQTPNPEAQYPRWVLRANAAKEVEVLLGQQAEAARYIGVDRKTLSNFLSGTCKDRRLLREWKIKFNPVQFVSR